jgi:hypothetical protein
VRPLAWIATGFVVVVLTADRGGWDLLPDPVGWALVLLGTWLLPRAVGPRRLLVAVGAGALLVAAATWPPQVAERVRDADPGLVWALGLPELGYVVVLAHVLSGAATRAGDTRAAATWSGVRTVTVVVALLPAVVIGGGVESLRGLAGVATVLAPVVVVVLLLVHAGRVWAAPETTPGRPPQGTAR